MEARPDRSVSAFRRLEAAERNGPEAKLGELLEGIRAEREKRLPRGELKRGLEAIMTSRPVDVTATEGQPGGKKLVPLFLIMRSDYTQGVWNS